MNPLGFPEIGAKDFNRQMARVFSDIARSWTALGNHVAASHCHSQATKHMAIARLNGEFDE